MNIHLSMDVSKDQLSTMATLVKRSVAASLKALVESEPILAQNVIENDKVINSYEIDIDNSTYNILGINQVPPDALRVILSIQKINVILERIGDHSVNIAESAISLVHSPSTVNLFELPRMGELCLKMLEDALDSFFEGNLVLARQVLCQDQNIDDLNIGIGSSVKAQVHNGSLSFETAMETIRISKNLERIADLASNIAEEACFAVNGAIVKHHVN